MSRKYNVLVDFTAYSLWHAQRMTLGPTGDFSSPHPHSSAQNQVSTTSTSPNLTGVASSAEQAAPYPLSFNHIVDLITSGKPIPGIKEIPDTILDGQASHTTQTKRKKPWETHEVDEDNSENTAATTLPMHEDMIN